MSRTDHRRGQPRFKVVDSRRELCGTCGTSPATRPLGICRRCQAAHEDLAAFDASVDRIREARP